MPASIFASLRTLGWINSFADGSLSAPWYDAASMRLFVLVAVTCSLFGCRSSAPAPDASVESPPPSASTPPIVNTAKTYRGHAVYFLDATTPCPKVAIGTRGEHACLRVALDDDHTTAEVDAQKHRITIRNDSTYADEQIIGDVVLPGWSESESGKTPVSVHAVFRKKGGEVSTKVYSHVVVREKPKSVTLEDFEIVLAEGTSEKPLMTKEQAQKAVLDSSVAAKAAGFFMEMRDNLAKGPDGGLPAVPNEKAIADITIAAGLGPAADKMLRAQLFKNDRDVTLRFTALSGLVPKYIAQRDVFLYGVETAPSIADVKARGLAKGETLEIAFTNGKGTVRLGDKTSPLEHADDCVHDFLQTAALGMLLAHQAKLDGG